jgi:hypothetical protein
MKSFCVGLLFTVSNDEVEGTGVREYTWLIWLGWNQTDIKMKFLEAFLQSWQYGSQRDHNTKRTAFPATERVKFLMTSYQLQKLYIIPNQILRCHEWWIGIEEVVPYLMVLAS